MVSTAVLITSIIGGIILFLFLVWMAYYYMNNNNNKGYRLTPDELADFSDVPIVDDEGPSDWGTYART